MRQHEILSETADLVDRGVLRSTMTESFGVIDAANLRRAHAQLESGTTRGKVVLDGWGSDGQA
jgi:NADPH2:quinone reductase